MITQCCYFLLFVYSSHLYMTPHVDFLWHAQIHDSTLNWRETDNTWLGKCGFRQMCQVYLTKCWHGTGHSLHFRRFQCLQKITFVNFRTKDTVPEVGYIFSLDCSIVIGLSITFSWGGHTCRLIRMLFSILWSRYQRFGVLNLSRNFLQLVPLIV